ncbi:hypothetical protein Dimus_022908 [Dionaea muscipula]
MRCVRREEEEGSAWLVEKLSSAMGVLGEELSLERGSAEPMLDLGVHARMVGRASPFTGSAFMVVSSSELDLSVYPRALASTSSSQLVHVLPWSACFYARRWEGARLGKLCSGRSSFMAAAVFGLAGRRGARPRVKRESLALASRSAYYYARRAIHA